MTDNIPTFSVSELSGAVKKTLETGFARIRVRGELSGVKRHSNGHLYLDLKDDKSVLNAVCWGRTRLTIVPENGMDVICTGRITTYQARSNYQLTIETMELAGEGALLKLLEDRKKRLAEEGLFALEHKKQLPFLPGTIGVITSPSGAVIRDILHRIEERCGARVLVWPVAVQGAGAGEQIAAAIAGFNAAPSHLKPDVLIVARGGGSIEDLMPFNEESVVRAVYNSTISLISAVGHETDTTLIDFVSDRRAPTPTAAAEIAVPVRRDILDTLAERGQRLARALHRLVEQKQAIMKHANIVLVRIPGTLDYFTQRLDEMTTRLQSAPEKSVAVHKIHLTNFSSRLRAPTQRLDHAKKQTSQLLVRGTLALNNLVIQAHQKLPSLRFPPRQMSELEDRTMAMAERSQRALRNLIIKDFQKLAGMSALLESYSYHNVLNRGYALVFNEERHPIISSTQLKKGEELHILFKDGEAAAKIIK